MATDANFRLKLKNRGIKDPELGSGWAYFVESTAYETHIRNSTDGDEVSHVSIKTVYNNQNS